MSAASIANPAGLSLAGLVTKASDDIAFRSHLKTDSASALADFNLAPDVKSALLTRNFMRVRTALFGAAMITNAETTVAIAVAVYTETAVVIAA